MRTFNKQNLSAKIGLFILILLAVVPGRANNDYTINNAGKLCTAIHAQGFFQKKLLFDQNSRLAFRNLPGPLGRGVCWWHSRFTRAAAYLAVFRPDISQKPTRQEVKEILAHIRKQDQIVEITGYHNLAEFSRDHKALIEAELNRWSIYDSFNFKLSNGLIGSSKEDPMVLEKMMDHLYQEVENRGRVVFQVLQLPGLAAHSWLVVGMKPTEQGYELSVVDSNYLEIRKWNYKKGQTQFFYYFKEFLPIVGHFVPYTIEDWQQEEEQTLNLVRGYCQSYR